MESLRVLLVGDRLSDQFAQSSLLSSAGILVHSAKTTDKAPLFFGIIKPQVVVVDLSMPGQDALALMAQFADFGTSFRALLVTAQGAINRVTPPIFSGAFDFLVMPFQDRQLLQAIRAAARDLNGAVNDNDLGCAVAPAELGFLGKSRIMAGVVTKIERYARSDAPVLITGDSGSGKRRCAQTIHQLSQRRKGPFIEVACNGGDAKAISTALFGTESSQGALDKASGGSLFLSGMFDLPMPLQSQLLKFLHLRDNPAFTCRDRECADVRIMCSATGADKGILESGKMREDLFYRLSVLSLHMPPLRARVGDILSLAQAALLRYSQRERKNFRHFSADAKQALQESTWPGNMTQLNEVVRSAVALHNDTVMTFDMLAPKLIAETTEFRSITVPKSRVTPSRFGYHVAERISDAIKDAVDVLANSGLTHAEIERRVIERVITHNQGSVPNSAKQLNLSPSTLYRKRDAWQKG